VFPTLRDKTFIIRLAPMASQSLADLRAFTEKMLPVRARNSNHDIALFD